MPSSLLPTGQRGHHPLRSRRVLLVAVLAGLLALVLFAEQARGPMLRLAVTIQGMAAAHPLPAMVLVVLFAAASAMLAFVSTAAIAPFLAATFGAPLAGLLLWSGWLLGGVVAYTIGRTLGRPVIHRLVSPTQLARYEEFVSHRAPFGLVLLFQLALPSEIPGYLLGMVHYSFPRYLLSLAIAELPWALVTVYLGAGVMERQVGLVAGIGAVAVAASTLTYWLLHRRLRRDGPGSPGAPPVLRSPGAMVS
ncbi:MAG: VTT domain-containing protein [Gemmatimonadales bacterium]